MTDSLFEILLNLFETSLSQLASGEPGAAADLAENEQEPAQEYSLFVRPAKTTSTRVLTSEEQLKLTKASYQFLMRMQLIGVVDADFLELVLHRLHISRSRIVTLQETKWTIRTIVEDKLSEEQLAFLDLVLYQKEDAQVMH